jgi:hypothetical protein
MFFKKLWHLFNKNKTTKTNSTLKHHEYSLPVNYNKLKPYQRKQVREQYIKLQNGKCYYCGNDLNKRPPKNIRQLPINKKLFPANFFKYPVHLHHNHETGLTFGAVHALCNAVLWQYEGE